MLYIPTHRSAGLDLTVDALYADADQRGVPRPILEQMAQQQASAPECLTASARRAFTIADDLACDPNGLPAGTPRALQPLHQAALAGVVLAGRRYQGARDPLSWDLCLDVCVRQAIQASASYRWEDTPVLATTVPDALEPAITHADRIERRLSSDLLSVYRERAAQIGTRPAPTTVRIVA